MGPSYPGCQSINLYLQGKKCLLILVSLLWARNSWFVTLCSADVYILKRPLWQKGARFLFEPHLVDWNVKPLDGAVVGMREGGSSLYADVNKNSHFQPVCALTDRSKTLRTAPLPDHARLLDWNNRFYYLQILGERTPTIPPLQVFNHWMFLWTLLGVARIISVSSSHFPGQLCHCPSPFISPHLHNINARLCTSRNKKKNGNQVIRFIIRRASRGVCSSPHASSHLQQLCA